jgi:LAS superfamily LD-carboxypeptidase LdcB
MTNIKQWKFPDMKQWKYYDFWNKGKKPLFALAALSSLIGIAVFCFPPNSLKSLHAGFSTSGSTMSASFDGASHASGNDENPGSQTSYDASGTSGTSGSQTGSSENSSNSQVLSPVSGPPVLQLNYAEVAVPSDFTSGASAVPEGLFSVPDVQRTMWMPFLSLFPGASGCTMFLWIDADLVDTVMTGGELTGTPTDSPLGSSFALSGVESSAGSASASASESGDGFVAVGTVVEDAGFLIAIRTENDITQAEILHVNIVKNETSWSFVPVRNATKGNLALTQQLRMVSPRSPLTKEQTDDISRLAGFDPGALGASGKSPFRMRTVAINPIMAMLTNAQADLPSLTITIRDTYRNYDTQASMFWGVLKLYREAGWGYTYEQAYMRTDSETAFPGTSEHHDGYTADVITSGVNMNQGFGSTAFGTWLAANCWDYGFVLRYLQGKEAQTTKKYEPWHVRYLGVPTALLLKRYGIVLEEFHAYMNLNRYLLWNCDDQPGSGTTLSSDFLYIQCRKASDLLLPSDITGYSAAAAGISGLLSEDGQGRLVLMCRFQ